MWNTEVWPAGNHLVLIGVTQEGVCRYSKWCNVTIVLWVRLNAQ